VWLDVPEAARERILAIGGRLYALDTLAIAKELAPSPELEQRMQGIVLVGVFLRVAPFIKERGLGEEEVYAAVDKSMRKFFGKRGEQVIQDNLSAVRRGSREVFEVPREIIEPAA
jgi:pyruvate-ferredoxin/flavodoxin oxidoreductase